MPQVSDLVTAVGKPLGIRPIPAAELAGLLASVTGGAEEEGPGYDTEGPAQLAALYRGMLSALLVVGVLGGTL